MSVISCRLHVFMHKLKCNQMRWFAERAEQQTVLVFSVLFKNVQHAEIRRKLLLF